ncbi:MAG TPA: alpha-L-arabinofuranosidase C-terminal domain-containing protein, partial [Capsulimonadaceae bacterium]|nr:alpha-L-arabinofuranosidase C-terminal domain-containing protein [Capsulimonadaceae bacterium]
MKKPLRLLVCVVCIFVAVLGAGALRADTGKLVVHLDQAGFAISPTFYGMMTEEINHAYDGGLYAELIRNRNLRDSDTDAPHWSVVAAQGASGTIAVDKENPVNSALPNSLRLNVASAEPSKLVGVANEGYWGIAVQPHTRYKASFYARCSQGFRGPLTVDLESSDRGTVYAKGTVSNIGAGWKKYTLTLTTGDCKPSASNQFVISASSPGSLWLSEVSLFPPTYHNRANGNRIDLMNLLAGLKPSFLRLPGGNYLEGNTIAERFDWKSTIHDISLRPGHQGPWGYRSTDGLGLLEFLEWCEDLRIQPVLAVYAGYSLRGEHVDPGPNLQPYVQDALDEIEYAMGDTNTPWGAQRAKDGHPKPFTIHYIEVGNEDQFDRSGSYDGRFTAFYDAIKAKYPNLKIIATTAVTSRKPDVLDDHYYRSAVAMERDSSHYDTSDRNGPKIFVGEWASTEGNPTPTLHAALGDAAWLTGLERNSDLVVMESYAPLLVNVNQGAAQWGTNLIGYNALTSFGSPSYYVQSMFGQNTGNTELPITLTQPTLPPAP